MEPISARERVVATLTYFIFFLPMLILEKTEFTLFHAKQALMMFLCFFLALLLSILPIIGGFIAGLMGIVTAIVTIFLAIKAYQGEKFLIAPLFEFANRLIVTLKLEKFYTPE